MLTRYPARVRARAIASIAISFLLIIPVSAWEEDVHSSLTFWLASQAGFSRQDAFLIANSDQGVDDSNHTSAVGIVVYILLTGSQQTARELQLKHFPSDAIVAASPQLRTVSPGNVPARLAADNASRATAAGDRLNALGEALHPFQDSWSHQGVPDVPYGLRPRLASGHPASRGGWKSHNADLTHLHVEETIDMARRTYEILQTFLTNNPSVRNHGTAKWGDVEPIAREFAAASDRAAKDRWATNHLPIIDGGGGGGSGTAGGGGRGSVNPSASLTLPGQQTTLPLGITVKRVPRIRATRTTRPDGVALASMSSQLVGQQAEPQRVDTTLIESANAFFNLWLDKRDIAAATRRAVALQLLAGQFRDGLPATAEAMTAWSEKFLTMLLVDDHSQVNRVGHCDRQESGYAELPRTPPTEGPFRSTRETTLLTVSAEDFVATDIAGPGGLALVLAMGNMPHDAVTLVWRKAPHGWSIVRMFALPM